MRVARRRIDVSDGCETGSWPPAFPRSRPPASRQGRCAGGSEIRPMPTGDPPRGPRDGAAAPRACGPPRPVPPSCRSARPARGPSGAARLRAADTSAARSPPRTDSRAGGHRPAWRSAPSGRARLTDGAVAAPALLLPARARTPTMTRQGYWSVKVKGRLTLSAGRPPSGRHVLVREQGRARNASRAAPWCVTHDAFLRRGVAWSFSIRSGISDQFRLPEMVRRGRIC
jgi:hypothetical protein